jgi:hypothetical protein
MRRADLEANASLVWPEYSRIEDVDFGLDHWERRVYTEFLRPSDRTLLVGSGDGRALLGLRELRGDALTGSLHEAGGLRLWNTAAVRAVAPLGAGQRLEIAVGPQDRGTIGLFLYALGRLVLSHHSPPSGR